MPDEPTDVLGRQIHFDDRPSQDPRAVRSGGPRWFDSLGNEVDLYDIDKEYALNILTMVVWRNGRTGYPLNELHNDELVEILRDRVLNGREPNQEDRARAKKYNSGNRRAGLPYRAPTR